MATPDDIDRILRPALAEEFEIEAQDIVPGAALGDALGIDSLDMVDLAVTIDRLFGIKTSREELAGQRTYGDLVTHIGRRLNAGA